MSLSQTISLFIDHLIFWLELLCGKNQVVWTKALSLTKEILIQIITLLLDQHLRMPNGLGEIRSVWVKRSKSTILWANWCTS